jgi:hypothetical protein
MRTSVATVIAVLTFSLPCAAQTQKPREHDLMLPIGGTPGPLNAITDIAGCFRQPRRRRRPRSPTRCSPPKTMTGANDLRVYALPVDRLLTAMKKYGRLP